VAITGVAGLCETVNGIVSIGGGIAFAVGTAGEVAVAAYAKIKT